MVGRRKTPKAALARLGLRTAGIAHDLVQPLTSALLAARQIKGKGSAPLRAALHRMEDLIQSIRTEINPVPREGPTPLADLGRIARDLRAGLSPAERRRVDIRLDGRIRADASALGRILGNLTQNALRHGRGRVQVRGSAPGGKLAIVVTGGSGKAKSETGWGIGLASSQELANRYGLTLRVEISPEGSRATLEKHT